MSNAYRRRASGGLPSAATLASRREDDTVGTVDDDLHLDPASPCIDTGYPATPLTEDIEHTSRPQGSGCDMGAYEQ